MTIATDLMSGMLKTRYTNEVNSISNRVLGLTGQWNPIGSKVSVLLRDFARTDDISSKLRSFDYNAKSYILNFDKPGSDNDILDSLQKVGRVIDCVRNDPELLAALGIVNWDELTNLAALPLSFINWLMNFSLASIFNRIIDNFPWPEFDIASKLSMIKFNTRLIQLPSMLTRLDYLVNCLSNSFDLDLSDKLAKVNGYLNRIYLDPNGAIDWSRFSGLSSTDINNIKSAQKTSDYVAYSTENNFNKRLGAASSSKKLFTDPSLLA